MATSIPKPSRKTRPITSGKVVSVLLLMWFGLFSTACTAGETFDALATPTNAVDSAPLADELWMINTRCLTSQACRANLESLDFSVSVYDGRRNMVPASLESLIASATIDAETSNVIYVHGNNFEADEVMERAWFVYQQIRCKRRLGTRIRFIVWSWPSQPETTPLKDVRLKAERTDAQGLYLSLFLREIASTTKPITLIGFSFGGRVITGSLHALAGGSLGGRVIPGTHLNQLNTHVGLVAPALDNDWLMPGKYHGLATTNMERISLLYNPRDLVLKRYWILDPSDWSKALGQAGGLQFGPGYDGMPLTVKRYNCSRFIGRRHEEEDYYSRTCGGSIIMARLIEEP